ncbi:protein lifeguard 1-like [Daphnia pulicaria]|uniref:protein lifeguard 1-like n=1 Tax=Daphnia pulicaria TaxID=35523 RepID=UPI001EEC5EA0|nr:protein lifeguard 1-like [Daphnia pulicaria]
MVEPPKKQPPVVAEKTMDGGADLEPGEPGDAAAFSYTEQSIRKAFVRKVYAILMLQLVITLTAIFLFVYEPNINSYFRKSPENWLIAVVIAWCLGLALSIVLVCCSRIRRRWPVNMILLVRLFTICEGIVIGAMSSTKRSEDVIIAVYICMAVCLALTNFAMQTEWDFTNCGRILITGLIVLVIFGIVAVYIPGKVYDLVEASMGAILFSVYLVYNTQMAFGGKQLATSPEEYVLAANSIYVDILNIYIFIVDLVRLSNI